MKNIITTDGFISVRWRRNGRWKYEKLYLDQSDGILGQKVSGQMLNAARLGLVFDENYSSEVIFKLSESQNASGQQTYNTVINGQTLGNNQVLSYTNGTVRAASDPSVSADGYTISFSDDSVDVPQNALSDNAA